MEGMVNLNITDTQRASNLSKNLSSIVLHKTGASNKIFPQKFDENLTLERNHLQSICPFETYGNFISCPRFQLSFDCSYVLEGVFGTFC